MIEIVLTNDSKITKGEKAAPELAGGMKSISRGDQR